jgi:hypothetical protein
MVAAGDPGPGKFTRSSGTFGSRKFGSSKTY